MAITSEIIGKLGGADVESTPASASVSGSGNSQILHTVNIPTGETWLVAAGGTGVSGSPNGPYMPCIYIGDTKVTQYTGNFAAVAIMTESGDVVLESNSSGTSSFEGNIYTVKM